MRSLVGGLLGLLWIILGYIILFESGKRLFARPYFARAVAAALVASGALVITALRGVQTHAAMIDSATPSVAASTPALPAPAAAGPAVAVFRNVKCDAVRLAPTSGTGSVDGALVQSGSSRAPAGAIASVGGSDNLVIVGWASAPGGRGPAAGICAAVDGTIAPFAAVTYGGPRPDVATAYHNPAMRPTGFAVILPAARLNSGQHTVRIAAVTADGLAEMVHGETIVVRR